jgi:hypothetical protein
MSKYLKNWKTFLLQEKQLDLFQGTIYERPELKYKEYWPITHEEIEDLLFELIEENYIINYSFSFVDETKDRPHEILEVLYRRELTPCVRVEISPQKGIKDENLTYVLTSFIKRVKPKFGKIELFDNDGMLQLNKLKIKGGIEYEVEPDDIVDVSTININLIWYKPLYLTDKMIFEYHHFDDKLEVYYDDKEQAYVTYPADIYAEYLISSRDQYYDILVNDNGFDSLWDRYWDYADRPDIESLFDYYLHIKTIQLLVDYLVTDFEKIKEVNEDEYDSLVGVGINSKEELISRVQKVGLKNIGNLLHEINEDFISEVRDLYSNMQVDAYVDNIQDGIVNALEEVIEDNLETKVVKTYWKDGHPFLTMKFNLDWLQYFEGGDEWLRSVWGEWLSKTYRDDNRLRVRIDEYVTPDFKDFNKQVQSMILGIMKREGRTSIVEITD